MIIRGKHQHGMGGANRSIRKQKKAFIKRGLALDDCFLGTINLNTDPAHYKVSKFDIFLPDVPFWSFPRYRREDFGFIRILNLKHRGNVYPDWGYIYFPHKSPHFQHTGLFELLGYELPGFEPSDEIEIEIGEGLMDHTTAPSCCRD